MTALEYGELISLFIGCIAAACFVIGITRGGIGAVVLLLLLQPVPAAAVDCFSLAVEPWANAAAAEVAVGQFPIRAYDPGSFLSTRYVFGSSDYDSVRVYRIDSVYSTGSASGCQSFTATFPPAGANPTINSAGKMVTTYQLSSASCGAGTIRYAQKLYNVTQVTPIASCTDGVLNGDELTIDCGGSCGDCSGTAPVDYNELISLFLGACAAGAFVLGIYIIGGARHGTASGRL